jgi:hypothetical protein
VSAAVRFQRVGADYAVKFRYDPDAVALVKALPTWARRWDPLTKAWYIDVGHAEELAADFAEIGYLVVGLERSRTGNGACNGACAHSGDIFAQLLRHVGNDRSERVFKALTRILHPDTAGGDGRLQQQLNDAYRTLGGPR